MFLQGKNEKHTKQIITFICSQRTIKQFRKKKCAKAIKTAIKVNK